MKKLIIGLIVLFLILTVRAYPLLTQEENTFLVFNGIVKLNLKDLDTFEYDSNSITNQYITKSKGGIKIISNMLKEEGWVLKEQFGSGYIFEYSTDEKQNITVESTQFSRYFKLWKIPHTSN